MAALTQLQALECSSTPVSDLSPLATLTQLKELYCFSTPVSDLSPLAALTQLQRLNCRNTQISDLSPLATLTQLKELYCFSTPVSDLSPLAALIQLQRLNCRNTQISDLSSLAALIQLQTLDCSDTPVSDLSSLAALIQLQTLDCSDTPVSDLSPLAALTQLQELSCSYTSVSDLSPLAALTQLQTLNCSDTQVSDLSPLKTLLNLRELHAQSCPIQNIPKEIYDQSDCAHALFTYWEELDAAQKTQNRQIKVMFLGNGCVGKSTIVHWFLNQEFTPISLEEGRTHGIFIKPYAFKNSEVLGHFWDFGGQEVFHATHRLFLGRRSLYVLVWAVASPEPNGDLQYPPRYWLDMIADIADHHERSRVLIVQNLFEHQKERNILSDAERADYEARGLDITTYCINAKTGLKVKPLLAAIEEEAGELIQTHTEELPQTWVRIRAAVAERRFQGDKMLEQADFEAICRACGLSTPPAVLLDYLHRAGELFYYSDRFENRIILDQEWALRAVYAILKRKNIEAFKGRMRRSQLVQMWKSDGLIRDEGEAKVFFHFMMANKVAFYTEGKDYYRDDENPEWVIPQLLPVEPPDMYSLWADIPDQLTHRIAYQFLHRDIIERFIVQTAHLSEKKEYWRNGLFINDGGSKAMVEVVPVEGEKDKKYIQIACVGAAREALLQKIREEFHKIRTLEKASEWRLEKDAWVPFVSKIHLEPGQSGGFALPLPHPVATTSNNVEITMKAHLLDLMAEDRLKEALEALRHIEHTQSKYFRDPLLNLLARYHRNERSRDEGTIAVSDYQLECNRMQAATRRLLESEFREEEVPGELRREVLERYKLKPAADGAGGHLVINKTITVPRDFKGGIFQNVVSPAGGLSTSVGMPQTILFAAANPSDAARLATDVEHRTIKEQMQLGDKRDAFNFLAPQLAVRITELIRAFHQKPDIIHFSGHGDTRGILITDDQNQALMLNEMAIKRLFKPLASHTRLVLLNSCYSAEQAKIISALGMHVIGNNAPVGDPAAIAFAKGFYLGLSEGKSFEEAFNDGMIVLAAESPRYAGVVEVWHNGEQLSW